MGIRPGSRSPTTSWASWKWARRGPNCAMEWEWAELWKTCHSILALLKSLDLTQPHTQHLPPDKTNSFLSQTDRHHSGSSD